MLTRRSFLRNTATLAAAAPFASSFDLSELAARHIGVQLWSVRDDMGKDAKGTIAAISKMGYREVEPFGFDGGKLFGMSYDDFAKLLKDNGLSMPSTHSMMTSKDWVESAGDISDAAKKNIDQAAKMGLKYTIVPYMVDEDRKQIDKMVKLYAAAGKYARKAGVRLAYHNHNFEYEMRGSDGRLLMEWLLHELDPKDVAMEMDIFWVAKAKHNPLDWFRLYPGRFELCHAKDMDNTPDRKSIEVGQGVIDFKSIFRQSAQAGLKHYVVELEDYRTTPLQGVELARKGLLKVLGA